MKIRIFALIAVAGLSLAACSGGGSDEQQPANETVVANLVEPENYANVTIETPATPAVTNISTATPPTADLTADEQTQDYADATGMTSKVDRNASDEGQPAQ